MRDAAARVALLAGPVQVQPPTRAFSFTAQGFNPPGGQDPVVGSVTVTVDLQGEVGSGPVEAVELAVGGVTYTPADTTYVYDAAVDRLSVRGDAAGEGPGSFDLEVRKASTAQPSPNDFAYFSRDGGYHVAAATTIGSGSR